MAEKRMFAKSIVLSDAFLDMPMSARCLYFTLNMFADDDGFVGSPKGIMRQCGSSQDDLMILLEKRFILAFESGVIVIKHWRINNILRSDRHKDTTYQEELAMLMLDENGAYTERKELGIPNDNQVTTIGKPNDNQVTTIGKPSIDKYSIDKYSIDKYSSRIPDLASDEMETIVSLWNSMKCTHPIKTMEFGTRRYNNTRLCARDNLDEFLDTIRSIDEQEWFQKGAEERMPVKYDWFCDPNNYVKVVEGNYRYLKKEETEAERKIRMIMES